MIVDGVRIDEQWVRGMRGMVDALDWERQALKKTCDSQLEAILSFIDEGVDELLVRRIWGRALRAGQNVLLP